MLFKKISLTLIFALLVPHATYTQPKDDFFDIETKERIQKSASDDQGKEQRVRAALEERGVLIIPRHHLDITPEEMFLLCNGWAVEEEHFMRDYYKVEAEVFANPDKYSPDKRAPRIRWCPILINCLNWLFGSAKNK